jgi:hypothetical protein
MIILENFLLGEMQGNLFANIDLILYFIVKVNFAKALYKNILHMLDALTIAIFNQNAYSSIRIIVHPLNIYTCSGL